MQLGRDPAEAGEPRGIRASPRLVAVHRVSAPSAGSDHAQVHAKLHTARGALRAIHEHAKRTAGEPHDLSLVGFAGLAVGR